MQFQPTEIPDVIMVSPQVFGDHRGFFLETYHREKFRAGGITPEFVQDNHSRSGKNILRGLHYQVEKPQGKLVRVIRGEVWDVAVDLRKSSPTFRRWVAATLSEENNRQLYIPPGFAHGFCVLSESADVVYKCTELYAPDCERTLLWNDPAIGITWPISAPILSAKDQAGKRLQDLELFP